jgi:murein L,D-transpeptidase YcbB/YkuD
MTGNHVRLLTLLVLCAASCSRSGPAPAADHGSAALRAAVNGTRPEFVNADGSRGRKAWDDERQFYEQNGYRLEWSDGRRPGRALDGLLRSLKAADTEGLDPSTYRVAELEALRNAGPELDVRATYAYLRYARDLQAGENDLVDALQTALADHNIERALIALAPAAAQYRGLKQQLALARTRGDDGRAQQIVMNMDRWRALPADLGRRYVMVNIPAFRLDVIEDGKSVLAMKVVTGKKSSPTPLLADEMTSIVFSPSWHIPQDIVEKEILPKLERDPSYLEKNNIEADEESGHYRQRPGKGNSLGGVKFLFPNHFNVYLHDTPSQKLFDRIERDFSHGCVRLDEPDALAAYVLRDKPEWTPEKIKSAMSSGVEQSVKLTAPLPIYLAYFTAWEENGALKTVPDVYGLDARETAKTVKK